MGSYKRKQLPSVDSFPQAFFNALIELIKRARTDAGEFEVQLREHLPKGVPGRAPTTGEEAERRYVQQFLQVLRESSPRTDLPSCREVIPRFKVVDGWRKITTGTTLKTDYHSGQLLVVSYLKVGPDYCITQRPNF